MSNTNISGGSGGGRGDATAPPTNKALLVAAGVCLLIPIVALCWVGSYAHEDPKLGGVPFFFWYQFLWVFLTAALTATAYKLLDVARRPGPGTTGHRRGEDQ